MHFKQYSHAGLQWFLLTMTVVIHSPSSIYHDKIPNYALNNQINGPICQPHACMHTTQVCLTEAQSVLLKQSTVCSTLHDG